MNNTTVEIHIVSDTLSDNSLAYAVRVNFDSDTLRLDMVSERDALAFAEGLQRLIGTHTNEEANVY